jgi:hypothetical protein
VCGLAGWYFSHHLKMPAINRAAMASILVTGMESRGRNSWGFYSPEQHILEKDVGLPTEGIAAHLPTLARSRGVLIHTRASTVGASTVPNAHPWRFENPEGKFFLVGCHNGGVMNDIELKNKYRETRNGLQVDSQHIFAQIAEERPLSELEAYGAITYYLEEKPGRGRFHLGRFNGGQLSVYGIGPKPDQSIGIVWASTPETIEAALRVAGVKASFRYEVREGELYWLAERDNMLRFAGEKALAAIQNSDWRRRVGGVTYRANEPAAPRGGTPITAWELCKAYVGIKYLSLGSGLCENCKLDGLLGIESDQSKWCRQHFLELVEAKDARLIPVKDNRVVTVGKTSAADKDGQCGGSCDSTEEEDTDWMFDRRVAEARREMELLRRIRAHARLSRYSFSELGSPDCDVCRKEEADYFYSEKDLDGTTKTYYIDEECLLALYGDLKDGSIELPQFLFRFPTFDDDEEDDTKPVIDLTNQEALDERRPQLVSGTRVAFYLNGRPGCEECRLEEAETELGVRYAGSDVDIKSLVCAACRKKLISLAYDQGATSISTLPIKLKKPLPPKSDEPRHVRGQSI